MTDLWTAVKDLPITIESSGYETLLPPGPVGMDDFSTTQLSLRGGGEEGLGEQIGLADMQTQLRASHHDLTGDFATLADYLEHVAGIDMWPEPPEYATAVNWRRWTFESAALDLALRQAGTNLPEVLGRAPRPVTFVTSFGLGDPPDINKVANRRALHPTVGFKLDVEPSWTQEIMDRVAAVDGVATIDFKGQYGMEVADDAELRAMYERTLATFPDAVFEDPHHDAEILELLAPVAGHVSYDAPVVSVESLSTLPFDLRIVNIKPSRVGSLHELSRLYAHCEAAGIAMYNGGMGELGVGRGQAQLLAALFHPEASNDIAPTPYNLEHPPAGLPESPLDPSPDRGFRRR